MLYEAGISNSRSHPRAVATRCVEERAVRVPACRRDQLQLQVGESCECNIAESGTKRSDLAEDKAKFVRTEVDWNRRS